MVIIAIMERVTRIKKKKKSQGSVVLELFSWFHVTETQITKYVTSF